MSSSRSLLSLGLQKDILAALTRNGYENLRDLNFATVEELTKGETSILNQLVRFNSRNPS